MTYRLRMSDDFPVIYSNANDIYGNGGEEFFPTINVPQELIHHTITFRVHSEEQFSCIGSGTVEELDSTDFQTWVLDTTRETSSYTVLFIVIPTEVIEYQERTINGVDV